MVTKEIAEISHCITQDTIDAFIQHEADKGASENMIRRFKGTLRAICEFLPDDNCVTKERLLEWRKSMEEGGYASITILNYVKYINRYLDFVGCSEIRFTRGKAKDITNMTFGLLTAIEPTELRNRGDVVWRCRCECGNIVELPATRLLIGNTSSCGCLQKQIRKDVFKKANKNFAGTYLTRAVKEKIVAEDTISGYVGVAPKRGKWYAHITYKGKRYFLGCYYDIDDAVKARARAKQLVIEDAQGLINFYDEIHKNDPEIYNRKNFEAPQFSKTPWVEKGNEPVSATKRANNTSGHTGVSFRKDKWEARICYKQIRYELGYFDNKEDAIAARLSAEQALKADPDKFVQEYSERCLHYHI